MATLLPTVTFSRGFFVKKKEKKKNKTTGGERETKKLPTGSERKKKKIVPQVLSDAVQSPLGRPLKKKPTTQPPGVLILFYFSPSRSGILFYHLILR